MVRVSGPQALAGAAHWFCPREAGILSKLTRPTVIPGWALIGSEGDRLPGELYVWPSERSYTCQPTLEFHTLGSPPLLAMLVAAVCRHDARVAEPGEFTLRAFLGGRLDLTQAEAVLGVIDANSQTELAVALKQLGGGLAEPLDHLRNQLLDLLAHLEAGLDFAEEDIEFISPAALLEQLQQAHAEVESLIAGMRGRSGGGELPRVVLYGRPNAGKSSLLNALTTSEQALVSAIPGTTRDYLAAEIDCHGTRVLLIDTAGIDPAEYNLSGSEDLIDSASQAISQQQRHEAHLQIFCLDANAEFGAWEQEQFLPFEESRLVVLTKSDVSTRLASNAEIPTAICTSSRTGQGLAELKTAMAARLEQLSTASDVVTGTADRCRDSLAKAAAALGTAIVAAQANLGEEFIAGDLRVALAELGRIAGAIYTDDILDRIFSRFCIGK